MEVGNTLAYDDKSTISFIVHGPGLTSLVQLGLNEADTCLGPVQN
jgi:hypothetical protein